MPRYQDSEPYYDAMQVCLNGHKITGKFHTQPILQKKYCIVCGAKTIYRCPNCKAEIEGDYVNPRVAIIDRKGKPVPNICQNCGQGFPWKEVIEKLAINQNKVFALEFLFDRIHLLIMQLRKRHDNRDTLDVRDEYDVQDLLHSLLRLYYDDIRAEEWNPSYAGSSTRSDFLLKNEKIVIEVKKTRSGLKARELGEQLIIDIAKYKTHPDCKVLFCFVYDPDGYINNPRGLENDLAEDKDGFRVIVRIVPKGH